jgi:hypothetical protein
MLARFDRINKAPFFTSARNSSYFIWKTLVTIYQGDLTQTGLAPKAKASLISCHLGLHVKLKKDQEHHVQDKWPYNNGNFEPYTEDHQ